MSEKRWLIFIIILLTIASNTSASSVYGNIYDFSDFDSPLKNAIVELEENSTRLHYKVSGDGTYFFNISPGTYILKSKYYNNTNNILELIGEENFTIGIHDESRNIDIILFPPIDQESEYLGDINLSGEIETKETDYSIYVLALIGSLVLVSIIASYVLKRRAIPERSSIPEEPLPPENISGEKKVHQKLPDDLKELLDIIIKKGGRITQKELRKEVIYGEAKVSLMITDLEDRGLVKKIKKGRSNIIIIDKK